MCFASALRCCRVAGRGKGSAPPEPLPLGLEGEEGNEPESPAGDGDEAAEAVPDQ